MGGLESLVDAVWRCPIPTSPSPGHVQREGFGLTLLALALRLEHVGRISETLSLVDSTHMARSVTVDVDLGALTDEQRCAVRVGDSRALCVPIARLPRRDIAAVVVRDAAGRVLPRSTRVEATRSLADGLHRAFRMLLDSDPRTDQDGSPLHRIGTDLNRAGWLIRAAITNLVENGPMPHGRSAAATVERERQPVRHPSSDRVTRSAQIRQAAQDAVVALFADGSPFPALLEIASTEHIVLAEVADGRSEVFLTYDAPLMPAVDAVGRAQLARRIVRGAVDEFTVEYRTIIPRAVDSYHVTIEVPPDISIRRFFLASDVDSPALGALQADMVSVASMSEELGAASPKLLELELQSIASRLAEFGRRRAADLALVTSRHPRGDRDRPVEAHTGDTRSASQLLTGAARPVEALTDFAWRYEADEFRKLADGSLPPHALRTLAADLAAAQVDRDIVLDNDPRVHAGHAHWRRRPFGAVDPSSEPVTVAVHATLVDDPPSLATNVWRFLAGILALVLGASVLLFPSWPPFGWGDSAGPVTDPAGGVLDSADALVTVLLLVPGLLLARLDIPRRASVHATLRRVPQLVAYTAVFVTAALALVVATAGTTVLGGALAVALAVLVLLLVVAVVNEIVKARRRRVLVPRVATTPRWLVDEFAGRARGGPTRPTVTFSTVELSGPGDTAR